MFYNLVLPEDAPSFFYLKDVDVSYVRELLKSRLRFDLAAQISDSCVIGLRVLPMGWAWAPFLAQKFSELMISEAAERTPAAEAIRM